MTEDHQLLHDYSHESSRAALEELIRRYLAIVYSSAFRQLRDPHLAEDVTQAVFLVLAEKAATIKQGEAVGGWLLAVTHRASVNVMRKRAMRQRHEERAARAEEIQANADEWRQIAPMLDSELNRLPVTDRDAIVLRFFQNRKYAEIGAELSLSEDAARKRVDRALQLLRDLLLRRGVTAPGSAIGVAISAFALEAIPRHVTASTISTAISDAPNPASASLAKATMNLTKWAKVKIIGTIAASLAIGSIGVVMLTSTTTQQSAVANTQPTAPPPATQPAAAASIVHLIADGMINLDAPFTMLPPRPGPLPPGLTPQQLQQQEQQKPIPAPVQQWISAESQREQQWRKDNRIAIAFMSGSFTAPGKSGKVNPMVLIYGNNELAICGQEIWEKGDAAAVEKTIAADEDWNKKQYAKLNGPNPPSQEQDHILTMNSRPKMPMFFAYRTVAGTEGVIRLTRFDSAHSLAWLDIMKVKSAPPTTQP